MLILHALIGTNRIKYRAQDTDKLQFCNRLPNRRHFTQMLLLRFVLAGAARVLRLAFVGCARTAGVALAVFSAVAARAWALCNTQIVTIIQCIESRRHLKFDRSSIPRYPVNRSTDYLRTPVSDQVYDEVTSIISFKS